jgi:curved DNA-binding protein
MEYKDYYAVLGVDPGADQAAIKQAYRQLARQHHPDVNPNSKEAEEKFKEINEAYQVLASPEQRQKYDELRAQYQRYRQTGGRPQDFNWQNWAAQPGEGVHVEYASAEDLEDLFGSGAPYSDFFTSMFGQAGARRRPQQPRRGRDVEYEVDVTLEEAFRGGSRLLQIGDRRIEARIPPGVRTGSRIRLSGQGEIGPGGGQSGDLYLVANVLPHPIFEREGDDIFTEVSVDVFTAIAGGEVHVPTLSTGKVLLKIPANTQAGRSFRLRGRGMPRLGKPEEHGDLYARVRLVLPEQLSQEEIDVLKDLAEKRSTSQPV